ncbi:hypothetical protein C8R44DRAFT_746565 [Mycena epipterygia]|nr:hypothetical protein C8R44DRAFT_746565 [Mycena epipterygia]
MCGCHLKNASKGTKSNFGYICGSNEFVIHSVTVFRNGFVVRFRRLRSIDKTFGVGNMKDNITGEGPDVIGILFALVPSNFVTSSKLQWTMGASKYGGGSTRAVRSTDRNQFSVGRPEKEPSFNAQVADEGWHWLSPTVPSECGVVGGWVKDYRLLPQCGMRKLSSGRGQDGGLRASTAKPRAAGQ